MKVTSTIKTAQSVNRAVTWIQIGVVAATTQSTDHNTITTSSEPGSLVPSRHKLELHISHLLHNPGSNPGHGMIDRLCCFCW